MVFVDSASAAVERTNLRELGLPSVLLSGSGKSRVRREMHVRRRVPVVTGYSQTKGYSEYSGLQWTILCGSIATSFFYRSGR